MIIIFAILTIIFCLILISLLKVRGITVIWIFNLGVLFLYHIGFWSLIYEDDIYFLANTRERMFQIVPDITFFTIISIFFLLIFNPKGVKPVRSNLVSNMSTPSVRRLVRILSLIVVIMVVAIAPFIDWASAPLFNIGSYSIKQLSIARSELFKGAVLESLSVPRYIVFYAIMPALFYFFGIGIRVSKVVLILGCLFGLLTLAKTFFFINFLCLFIGWWFRRGGYIPIILASIVLPVTFYIIVFASYINDTSRMFIEVLNVLFTRLIQAPVALVAVYKEIFSFDQGLRSSFWYTLVFNGEKVPIQQIAGQIIAPDATLIPNAACGILGTVYPNIPTELHMVYYAFFIGAVSISSYLISMLKNYQLRIGATVVIGLQSLFILLTDPLTAFNSYGFLWSNILVFLIIFGFPFLKVVSMPSQKL